MFKWINQIFLLEFAIKSKLECDLTLVFLYVWFKYLTTSFCFVPGVVLTLVIPAVSSGTVAGTLKFPLVPMGSAHGHTGHVRFLTSVELPEGFDMNFPPNTSDSTGWCCFYLTFIITDVVRVIL